MTEQQSDRLDSVQARMTHHIGALDYLQCNTKDPGLEAVLGQIRESMEDTKILVEQVIAESPPDF